MTGIVRAGRDLMDDGAGLLVGLASFLTNLFEGLIGGLLGEPLHSRSGR